MVDPAFLDMLPLGPDTTTYRKLSSDFVSTTQFQGEEIITVDPEGLRLLSEEAFRSK